MQGIEQNQKVSGQFFQDVQIDSSNCCNPSFRSIKSSLSIDNTINSQKSLKNSKEKGIKLTNKTKSFTTLKKELKLISKKSDPVKLNKKMAKKNQESQVSSNAMSALQRCVSYKNKRIMEHKQEQNEQSTHHLVTPTKQEQLYSTRKNTARTLNNSQYLPLIQKLMHTTSNNSNNTSVQNSLFKQFKQSKTLVHSQHVLLINSKQSLTRKTLQRVFEQTQGRRIVTLESQISHEQECSDEYSIAEAYDFAVGF